MDVESGAVDSPGGSLKLRRAPRLAVAVCLSVCLCLTLALASAAAASAETGISGRVTSTATKTSIQGIEVCAFALTPPSVTETLLEPELSCKNTNVNGEYTIGDLKAGEYEVGFFSPSGSGLNYVPQYYDGKSSFSEATPVKVAAGEEKTEIDAEMNEGGMIGGQVTDALTGSPVGEILVCAFSTDTGEGGCELTESNGKYTISALVGGEYDVVFLASSNSEYLVQYYNGAPSATTATQVAVSVGHTTSEINARLVTGARISGRVTIAATGVPIKGAEVCALTSFLDTVRCTSTNANGEYMLSKLAAGSYAVRFDAEPNFPVQYYDNKPTFSAAERVNVVASATATGIDAALGPPPQPPPPVVQQLSPRPEPENEEQSSPPAQTSVLSHAGYAVSVRDGRASVKVVCAGPKSCRGRLTLLATHIVKVKGKRKARTVAIGTTTVSLHVGATATVKIALNATGRQLLGAAHGRLHAHLSILQLEPAPSKTRTGAVQLVLVRAHSGKR